MALYDLTPDTVPTALQTTPQWLCWREEPRTGQANPAKVPLTPGTGTYASVTEPDTWATFTDAYDHYRGTDTVAGIGFVFTVDDPYVGIDLDDCRDPATGKLAAWTRDIVERVDSYTEASLSGTGVHVIARGDLPPGKSRRGDVELYDRARYFTVTGRHLSLTPATVNTRTSALAAVHAEYVAAEPAAQAEQEVPDSGTPNEPALADDDLIAYAVTASNGTKFQRLWEGDTSGYTSHSEADQALCNLLAFWTGGDPQRIERLFAQSGLVRDKWEERPDYREQTIRTAIRDCPAYYDA